MRWKMLVGWSLFSLAALFVAASWIHLELPVPTGSRAVGVTEAVWTDNSRPETHTPELEDHRQVQVLLWYPAVPETGDPASYVPNLRSISAGLVASGELSAAQVFGLRWVRSHARVNADVDSSSDSYPVIILSPGNATNVEFYGSLAQELASHGYVVVGVNHPYQVAAVELADGSVATYEEDRDIAAKIVERTLDLSFVIDKLEEESLTRTILDGTADTERLGIMGHSNGGTAAAELCQSDQRIDACLNIDGQAAGGPFGTSPEADAPDHPFMFLTKESRLHEVIAARFEEGGRGTYRVVLPAASHEQFADGDLLQPGLWPFIRTVDRVHAVSRGFMLAFFDLTLRGADQQVLGEVFAPTDVYVYVYPLERS
jgi:dienelactone hydrolase